MFLQIERRALPGNDSIFDRSPTQIIGLLEEAWGRRYLNANAYSRWEDQAEEKTSSVNPTVLRATFAGRVQTDNRREGRRLAMEEGGFATASEDGTMSDMIWDHLVFAYLVEATGVYEIVAKIIAEYLTWQRREVPNPRALRWLTTTESLFYTHPMPYSVLGITSNLRPEVRMTRVDDYARMFGLPLPVATTWDGRPMPRPRAAVANVDFVDTLEQFLVEVWTGIENRGNTSGPRSTDNAAIARLARRLFDLLVTARRFGTLDRNEFVHVSTMSWLYLVLLRDYPLIQELKAEGSSPTERLANLAARVGTAPHSRTEQFLALADSLPTLLRTIETGRLNTPTMARALYDGDTNPLRDVVEQVIVNWSISTGRDLKDRVTANRYLGMTRPAPPLAGRTSVSGPRRPAVTTSAEHGPMGALGR